MHLIFLFFFPPKLQNQTDCTWFPLCTYCSNNNSASAIVQSSNVPNWPHTRIRFQTSCLLDPRPDLFNLIYSGDRYLWAEASAQGSELSTNVQKIHDLYMIAGMIRETPDSRLSCDATLKDAGTARTTGDVGHVERPTAVGSLKQERLVF